MKNFIKNTFQKYGFSLEDEQVSKFERFMSFLLEENQKFNLTAITDEKEVVVKHFVDSVLGEKFIKQNAYVIDVGTGAGFPGIPLKILRPDIKLVLLDSLQKRVNFLKDTVLLLGLDNVKCVHSRAEDYCSVEREMFDIATSRAVAAMPTLCEYLLPYVKVGGKVIVYKGQKAAEEVSISQKAIGLLGGKICLQEKFILGEVESERQIILIEKIKNTDKKYPRGRNLPKIKPII